MPPQQPQLERSEQPLTPHLTPQQQVAGIIAEAEVLMDECVTTLSPADFDVVISTLSDWRQPGRL